MNAVVDWGDDSGEVLLVGGESVAAEMYRMKLQLDGYHVIFMDDIGDVARHRSGWRPDIVLFDVGAGGRAQLRDLERVRADPLLAGVPALLLSTQSEAELRQRGFTFGPTDYLLPVAAARSGATANGP